MNNSLTIFFKREGELITRQTAHAVLQFASLQSILIFTVSCLTRLKSLSLKIVNGFFKFAKRR